MNLALALLQQLYILFLQLPQQKNKEKEADCHDRNMQILH